MEKIKRNFAKIHSKFDNIFSLNCQKTMSEIGQLIPGLNTSKIFKQFELAS